MTTSLAKNNLNLIVILFCACAGIVPNIVLAATDDRVDIIFRFEVTAGSCSFNNQDQTVYLDDTLVTSFTDNAIRGEKDFDVDISCSGTSTVKIVPTGTPDTIDPTAFKNTSSASNVALRLLDSDNEILLPDGTKSVTVNTNEGSGSYRFRAGYVASEPGNVTAGNFISTVNLNFEYD